MNIYVEILLFLYCVFVILNVIYIYFMYIIKIILKGKKEGKNNKGKWVIL